MDSRHDFLVRFLSVWLLGGGSTGARSSPRPGCSGLWHEREDEAGSGGVCVAGERERGVSPCAGLCFEH